MKTRRLLLCFLFSLSAGSVWSQTPAPTPTPREGQGAPALIKRSFLPDGGIEYEYADGTKRREPPFTSGGSHSGGSASDVMEPVMPPPWLKDSATNTAFLRAMSEYYAYRVSGLQHRSRVFQWQLLSSKIIFLVVLALVASGIVFAALQFRAGLARATASAPEAATEIDLSPTSVKVSSPVLGVIILIISLAFFYLYLVYVYPISEIV